jgi:L-aspartate oxidase
MRALCEAVRRTPSITVLEGVEARRLLTQDGAVVGVLAMAGSRPLLLSSGRIVIATGGIGGLYRHTTNPLGSVGQGVALAAHAGAELADMEFVQFHPTALDVGLDPMPLVSEAVRGEGATLIDEAGTRIMAAYDRGELEPRDVVARAIWQHLARGHRVFIDARAALGSRFPHRFPGINACCRAAGIDPASMPVPVRPAAHYHMGGIAVDDAGRSFIPGLWACGEAAATGLHGANRLASNSLLEATAYARWVADSVRGTITAVAGRVPAAPVVSPAQPDASAVRPIMTEHVGVLRDRTGLTTAVEALERLAGIASTAADAAAVGLIIATAALMRAESRGGHCRTDFPLAASRPRRSRTRLDLANAPSAKVISGWSAVSAGV